MPKHEPSRQAALPPAAPVESSETSEPSKPVVSAETAAHRERTVAQAARIAAPAPKIAPRFAPGRVHAVPSEADGDFAGQGLVVLDGKARCGRQSCGGGQYIDRNRDAFADLGTLGWKKFRGHWFCSATCAAHEATSPSITLEPARSKPAALSAPHTLRVKADHVYCDRPDCGARAPVHGMTDPARMIAAAVANGFVQTSDGVFCSGEHAREVVRGAHAAKQALA